jgi:outer membrane immunogenic protein
MKVTLSIVGSALALLTSTSVFAQSASDRLRQLDAEINKLQAERAALAKNPRSYVAPAPAPASAPTAAPAKSFSWTGFYGGVHTVVSRTHETHTKGSASQTIDQFATDGGGNNSPSYDEWAGTSTGSVSASEYSTLRPSGGAELGFNYQMGNFVGGMAVDYTWFGIRKSASGSLGLGDICTSDTEGACAGVGGSDYSLSSSYDLKSRMNALATARGKVGLAFDNFMLFGSGGLAMGDVHHRLTATGDTTVTEIDPTFTRTKSGQRFGWVAGGGIEYAVSRNISLKSEYYYYDLGTTKFNGSVSDEGNTESFSASFKLRDTGQYARVGLNIRY